MKHIFILNPTAGQKSSKEKLENELSQIENLDYIIECTKYSGHAKELVNDYIQKYNNTPLRFYACGGDGTINEVASCVCQKDNVSMAVIPYGSGNDFVKYFGGQEKFNNIYNIINGNVTPIDIMKIGNNYSINVCNFGFDSVVGKTANEVKLKGGKNPYGKGVRKAIFTGMKSHITVEVDGNVINPKGKMLLCTLGNGNFVGGEFMCSPRSKIDDGLIEVCLIDCVSIFTFLKLLPSYRQGKHLDAGKKFIHYAQGKSIKMYSKKDFDICLDGEMVTGNNFEVEILHNAVNFVIPKE